MKILLTLTLSGSVLTLLLLFLRYFVLRKMPSTVYYYAWILVLLRFALPIPGLIPVAGETEMPDAAVYGETVVRDSDGQVGGLLLPNTAPGVLPGASGELQVPDRAAETAETQKAEAAKPVLFLDWRSPKLWLLVWASGAILSLGLTVFSYLRFTGHIRREQHRPDRFTRELYAAIPGRRPALFQSDAIRTPLMYGVFSPKIVLPERVYEEELLSNILRHELMHYRRFDTFYKWIAAAILSAHWFNPLSWLVRRELNRACELSCDEMLLRSMTRTEKQSYGNTLLSMAAMSALPAGVVATTFATEKRNLKERLVQIMNYKKSGARLLASVLAVVLLTGCGMAAGLHPQRAAAEAVHPGPVIRVTNVDELLTAIAPNTVIELAAGEYDLSTAKTYGADTHSSYYSWNGVWGEEGQTHAELVVQGVDGLTLRGAGAEETTIAAVPRYANVIRFVNCRNLRIEDLTAGHTTEPGFCSGGVLRLESCTDARIENCGLFGCGTVGVDAADTNGLSVSGCRIYECSYNAVSVHQCREVRVEDCEIFRHGTRDGQGPGMALFSAVYSDGVVIRNNDVHDNASQFLMQLNYTKNAAFLSNRVHDNRFDASVFVFEPYGPMVDGCLFTNNGTVRNWVQSNGVYANDETGKLLDASDFETMTYRELDPDIAATPAPMAAALEMSPGTSVTVRSVDEFLAAIGPDRSIILEGELFDLSTASNYGGIGTEYYYWNENPDGPGLVIHDVSGLSIGTPNADRKEVTLAAVPRYANVLSFRNCEKIQLMDFTAGHSKEPGACSGGVLEFQGCSDITVYNMGLYGCGILGIQTAQCTSLTVRQTEIYECSQGAGQFFRTDGIVFDRCDVHDVPSPAFRCTECGDGSWNGEPFNGLSGLFDVDATGALFEIEPPREEESEYHGAVEDLSNPFAMEPSHHYQAGTPQSVFAAAVQQAIASDDWEALADRIAFPLQFFTVDYSFVIHDREEYLNMVRDGYFTNETFTDDFRFRERIAADDLSEFGSCLFGDTCLGHLVAFSCVGDQVTEDNLKITAISVLTPFWPGRSDGMAGDEAQPTVLVTPQP